MDASFDDAALATYLVREAGNLALDMRAEGMEALRAGASIKTGVSDIVTAADVAAEKFVVEALRAARPNDSILGEEGASYQGSSNRVWVIDPVDGTFNFASGSSYWCSALALVECPAAVLQDADDAVSYPSASLADISWLTDAEPLLGAIYQPQEDKLWLGGLDIASSVNGVPVAVDSRQDLSQLSTASYIHPGWLAEPRAAEPWKRAAELPATLRMLGSGSCDLSRVAQGELGAWFQHSCPAWDWLPGKAIVRAGGGDTGVVRVNDLDWFVAGPAGAVEQLKTALVGLTG